MQGATGFQGPAMTQAPPYDPAIHHRRSIRLRGYDYSKPGRYFVTMCVAERHARFGSVVNGRMV